MNIYLLEGKYTHYICLADDLLEVEKQLYDRYNWAKNVLIRLIPVGDDGFDHHLYFNIYWDEFCYHDYKDIKKETQFEVLIYRELPKVKGLIPQYGESYY